MKKLLIALALLAPLTVSSAITQYRMTWDALPADQTVIGKCQAADGTFVEIGRAAGNGSIVFSRDVNPGDTFGCHGITTKPGLADTDPSEVAVIVVPLSRPTNVQVVPLP